jgi:hypothetical protein
LITARPPRPLASLLDPRRSPPAPIVFDSPPALLTNVPTGYLAEHKRPSPEYGLLGWLRDHGIVARPTLAEVEAERVRRGLRSGVVASPEPVPAAACIVLPMRPEYRSTEETREGARRNRARLEEALADLAGDAIRVFAIRLGGRADCPRERPRDVLAGRPSHDLRARIYALPPLLGEVEADRVWRGMRVPRRIVFRFAPCCRWARPASSFRYLGGGKRSQSQTVRAAQHRPNKPDGEERCRWSTL